MNDRKQTGIGLSFMMLGIIMMIVPLIVLPLGKLGNTITESSIQIFVPVIGVFFFIVSLPIILHSKKGKNLKLKSNSLTDDQISKSKILLNFFEILKGRISKIVYAFSIGLLSC